MLRFPFLTFPNGRELSAGWNLVEIITKVANQAPTICTFALATQFEPTLRNRRPNESLRKISEDWAMSV
jgi:hypothetical protein